MENAFDALSGTTQPTIQTASVLKILIGTAWGPDQVVGLIEDLGLPFQADEAFISEKITTRKLIYDGFCCMALIRVCWNQIIQHRNASHGADGNQFEAEIFEIATDTDTITSFSEEITALFVALVAQHWYWFGIHQIAGLSVPTFLDDPILAQLFNQKSQSPRPAIELALINLLRKHIQVISAYELDILCLARVRNVILRQHQGHHFAICKFGFPARLASE